MVFLPRRYASAVYATYLGFVFICPLVCLQLAGIVSKRKRDGVDVLEYSIHLIEIEFV